jgi:hypothetical protein
VRHLLYVGELPANVCPPSHLDASTPAAKPAGRNAIAEH